MAEAQAAKAAQVLDGVARLVGRITQVRKLNGQSGPTCRTLMRLPAPDSYSSPQTVEVRGERFGQVGEEVAVIVSLGGYPRTYETRGDHGEPGESVKTAENVYTFVRLA